MHPFCVLKTAWLSLLLCACAISPLKSHADLFEIKNGLLSFDKLGMISAKSIYITTSTVSLLQNKSVTATVLTKIPKGVQVKVIDSSSGNWWQVRYDNRTGYIQRVYLKYSSVNDQVEYKPIYNTSSLYNSKPSYTIKSALNLHEHKSSSSAILSKLPKGAKVKLLDSSFGNWRFVHYQGRTGYIKNITQDFANNTNTSTAGPILTEKGGAKPNTKPTHTTRAALSMREKMAHSSAILLDIPKDAPVTVIHPDFNKWSFIEYKGIRGYVVSGQFAVVTTAIPKAEEPKTPKPEVIGPQEMVTATATNHTLIQATSLRARPDGKAKVLKRFALGDQVTVLDNSGEWWWKVNFNGKEGWVKRRLLEEK